MTRMPGSPATLLLAVVLACPIAIGADQGWQRVAVTDARARAQLGVDDAALPVHAWRGPTAPAVDAGIVPIGRGQRSALVMGSEFVGNDAQFLARRTGFPEELFCAVGSPSERARARLPLPSDRRLLALDVWGRDAAASHDLRVRVFEYCQRLDQPSEGSLDLVATALSSGAGGYFRLAFDLPPIWPATAACSWYLEVDFGPDCPGGTDLRLGGVRVSWDQP
jgi:hypothetical protein